LLNHKKVEEIVQFLAAIFREICTYYGIKIEKHYRSRTKFDDISIKDNV
jgi:hypothetical protein